MQTQREFEREKGKVQRWDEDGGRAKRSEDTLKRTKQNILFSI